MPVMPRPAYIYARIATNNDRGCWMWQGTLGKRGYGRAGSHAAAHRMSYEIFRGPIPAGLELDHLCRVPACVNPAHLEPVTPVENRRRQTAAVTHCKNGHELTPENTYTHAKFPERRRCMACDHTVHISNHGTLRRYNRGCRCAPCVAVKHEYRAARVKTMGWAAA